MYNDVLLPASLLVRVAGLPPAAIGILLLAWGGADRDGLLHMEKGDVHRNVTEADVLEAHGLMVVYPHGDPLYQTEWKWAAWLPLVAASTPPPSLQRPTSDVPPPFPDIVSNTLARLFGRAPTDAECRKASPRTYGKKRAASLATGSPEDEVGRAWFAHVHGEEGAETYILGPAGRRSIALAIKELGGGSGAVAELVLLFEYVFTAPDTERGPKWLRDNNYTAIDNLTVVSKLRGRVDAARAWKAKQEASETAPPSEGVDLGPLAKFRRNAMSYGDSISIELGRKPKP